MPRVFIATAKNKQLEFSSGLYERMFRDHLASCEGEEFRITKAKSKLSDRVRRYYFAVVVPTVKRTVPEWSILTDSQVHEALKKTFHWFEAWNPMTERKERFGQSMMSEDCTTEAAMDFTLAIETFLWEKYQVKLSSPEEYKKLQDIASFKNEN